MTFAEASLAKPMRRLAVLHTHLYSIREGRSPKTLKLVALFLSFPVFELHNLLFKLRYAASVRRMRFLGRKQRLMGIEDKTLQIDLDLIDRRLKVGSIQALNDVLHRLQAAKSRRDFRHPDHFANPPFGKGINRRF